jgi:menaquinone-specific isochorismate synthase
MDEINRALVSVSTEPNIPGHGPEANAGVRKQYGAHLPHWTRDDATYAVTFRLADAVPQSMLRQWMYERTNIEAAADQVNSPKKKRLAQLSSERIESYLDSGRGCCWLGLDPVAGIVAGALRQFDGICYGLSAWSIMPNHVHAVLQPLAGHQLSEILHSWKSFTSMQANRHLKRSGWFWQQESYDHLIRDEVDFIHAVEYVLQNPVKAGLRDWKWVWVDESVRKMLAEHRGGKIAGHPHQLFRQES